ncbi:hypothetical protein Q5H93_10085 [Hymenobacter sp. ASUV-10]|uniref:CBM-cenC domain-containing protein n=1 Tax=Hymenobacter aranciens TaxID=3063996 RepID=A0ABT9BBL0_9BACT|nr:hypothetical protein [Hymenobacter sp. ASUV-10]MDO7875079.1 hypothetical protein [Hymenobacter sp. ASUV-10]
MMAARLKSSLSLLLLGLLTLPGCHPRDGRAPLQERELMQTSFEELDGWGTDLPGLTTEKAHSGRYAVRSSPQQPFTVTYRAALGRLSPHHRPLRLTLGAWVWVPTPYDDARIVLSIVPANDPDHPLLSQSIFLSDSRPYGQWKYVSRSFNMPDGIHSDHRVVIYLWNGSAGAPVYADDLRLTELW